MNFTRKDYMDGRMTHHEYYSAIAKEACISLKNSKMLPEIKTALASGDQHLNSIKLAVWDMMAAPIQNGIDRIMKNHDDYWTPAGAVCVMKAAALNAAMEV